MKTLLSLIVLISINTFSFAQNSILDDTTAYIGIGYHKQYLGIEGAPRGLNASLGLNIKAHVFAVAVNVERVGLETNTTALTSLTTTKKHISIKGSAGLVHSNIERDKAPSKNTSMFLGFEVGHRSQYIEAVLDLSINTTMERATEYGFNVEVLGIIPLEKVALYSGLVCQDMEFTVLAGISYKSIDIRIVGGFKAVSGEFTANIGHCAFGLGYDLYMTSIRQFTRGGLNTSAIIRF